MITFCFLIELLLARNWGVSAQHSSVSVGQNVIVSMKKSTIPIINSVDEADLSRDELATILRKELKAFSKKSQAGVVSMLEETGNDFQSFWITNQIFVKEATRELISSLKVLSDVKSVEKERLIKLELVGNKLSREPNGAEWHLKKMEVEKVWRKTKGEGIIVAVIDSGVRGSHEALKNNYIGSDNYGWFDPILFSSEPEDFSGHGTHVMGILAGSGGIGAAPKAKWMACRAALDLTLHEHALVACAQFILCPSLSNKTCEGVPHIVSNSWGGGGGDGYFTNVAKAWIKVGIKPFFAAGNEGPNCKSVGSPADYSDVIAVGSADVDDRLDHRSSRGPPIQKTNKTQSIVVKQISELTLISGNEPTSTDKIKPDILAPGVDINSAFSLTDKSYIKLSGTSMATPAAAGVAALLLSIQPELTLDELKNLLYTTTDKELSKKGDKSLFGSKSEQCGNIPEDKFPNNLYGHGRINAFKAYKKLIKIKKKANKKVLNS